VYRHVLLVGRHAWKIPRLRHFADGMRCNRWEREMWRVWRPIFKWQTLCPVLMADPLGVVIVMSRAAQPVTSEEVLAIDDYPDITSETKIEDWGRINSAIVAVDYGLPDKDMVAMRRAYYRKMAEDM
jgi:hypothetical protein